MIALPDQEWGSRVVAVVETGHGDASVDLADVRDFVSVGPPAGLGAARRHGGAAPADAGERQGRPAGARDAGGQTGEHRRDGRRSSLPMNVRFRGVTARQGVLISGDAGWAEFSPFVEYADEEAASWLAAALEAAQTCIPGSGRAAGCRSTARSQLSVPSRRPRSCVPPHGCRTAKVKVAEPGQSLADDLERVAAVRDALGPTGRVRVDANGGWSVAEAVDAIRQLARVRPGVRRTAVLGRSTSCARSAAASTYRSRPTSRSARPAIPCW